MHEATALYHFLKAEAGEKPAIAIPGHALSALAVKRFQTAAGKFSGIRLPLDVPGIAVIPKAINVDVDALEANLIQDGGGFALELNSPLEISLALVTDDGSNLEYSEVRYGISSLRFRIDVAPPELVFSEPEFDAVPDLIEAATRADGLASTGIDSKDLERIEGAIAFLMRDRIVADIFGQVGAVNLQAILTAFRLSGAWRTITDGNALCIIPEAGIEFLQPFECPIEDTVGDLILEGGNKQSTADGKAAWDISVAHNPPADEGGQKPMDIAGFVSVYLPKKVLEVRFDTVRPGIPISMRSGGFLNYGVDGSVWLDYAKLSIDVPTASLLLDLEIHGSVHADISVKVPCVGNKKVARADAQLGASSIRVRYQIAVQGNQKLVLRAHVEQLAIGRVEVEFELFAKWLAFAGGQALIVGLILDTIMAKVAEHNIPIELRKAIRKEVNSQNMDLLDLTDYLEFAKYTSGFNVPGFGGDAEGILIGLLSEG